MGQYGGMPQLDEKILNRYNDNTVAPAERYATITANGKVKFFKNLTLARVDVVKNYNQRKYLRDIKLVAREAIT